MFEEDIHNLSIDSVRQKPKTALPEENYPTRVEPARRFQPKPAARPARGRRFGLNKNFWAVVLVLMVGAGLVYGVFHLAGLAGKIFNGKSPFSFLSSFGQLLTAGDRRVDGEKDGEVNILLLGIGGEGHQGALLTDTMILASIRPAHDAGKTEIAFLSIPRDYAVKLPVGSDLRKINSAYAYGEMRQEGLGSEWAIRVMENLTGKNIPYYALVDFSGFKQAIDDLGGIDVQVETAFSDSGYPDSHYGYLPTIRFEKGLQHMDGERALQFARSRHGTNDEGSDFARSRRQELVLSAIKEKILKLNFASDLKTITKLLSNFAGHFKTNLEPWEVKRLYDLTREVDAENLFTVSLDPETGLICSAIDQTTGAYILSPCYGKTSDDIQRFVKSIFEIGRIMKESPRIEFQNSTEAPALAQRALAALLPYSADAVTTNYPANDQLERTIVFDLSGGQKPDTLEYLKSKLPDAVFASDYPYPDKLRSPKPDFVIVLGVDVKDAFPEIKSPPPVPEPSASNAVRLGSKATTTKP